MILFPLQDGSILFQYNLGSGVGYVRSPLTYNDGTWHQVDATRVKKHGLLKMDGNSGEYVI